MSFEYRKRKKHIKQPAIIEDNIFEEEQPPKVLKVLVHKKDKIKEKIYIDKEPKPCDSNCASSNDNHYSSDSECDNSSSSEKYSPKIKCKRGHHGKKGDTGSTGPGTGQDRHSRMRGIPVSSE